MHLAWTIPVSLVELDLWSSSTFLALSSKVVMFGLLLICFGIKRQLDF